MIGDDAEMQRMIAEESVNAAIAQMSYDARTSAGLTQRRLAELVGTKQPVIARDGARAWSRASASTRPVAVLLGPQREVPVVGPQAPAQEPHRSACSNELAELSIADNAVLEAPPPGPTGANY